jgi:hypothetical protein
MQILNVGLAKSIWLFDINDLNPTGKMIFPEILTWIGERYSFQTYPKIISEVQEDNANKANNEAKGFIFKTGVFKSDDDPVTVNLAIHTDGVVAESWASTEKSDQFLGEVLGLAATKFKLKFSSEIIRKKLYVSELNVRIDPPLANIGPKISRFSKFVTGLFEQHDLPPFEMTAIGFSPDTSSASYKAPSFVIERKVGAPFTEKRYWSKAPFPTRDHLAALAAFEKQVLGE